MSVRSAARRFAVVTSIAALTLPLSLSAQGSPVDGGPVVAPASAPATPAVTPRESAAPAAASSASVAAAAPRRDASVAGLRLAVATDAPRPAALAQTRGRGQTLAIVGGVAFIGGLLIGDDVGTAIAVGGLAAGVYGLWLWLK